MDGFLRPSPEPKTPVRACFKCFCVCVCVRLNVDLSHMSKPNPRSAVPRGVRAEREHLSIG